MPSSRCFRITKNAGGDDGSDEQVQINADIAAAQQNCLNEGCDNLTGEAKIECNSVRTETYSVAGMIAGEVYEQTSNQEE